ncbi:phosphate ABC transporter ATP-binding protein PstB [Candidatus Atelocyanobacterium thalassae]|nr:phosphate ABC transporter ATP-binding protein PstB [Candidatus Atelocyanobacterium thalassa]
MEYTQDCKSLETLETIFALDSVNVYYGRHKAIRDVTFTIPKNRVTALIGPSGCGKSTILRSLNRLNDLIDSFYLKGKVTYCKQDLYASNVDPIEVRKRIGMVFQKPNPFPKTIYNNVAYGARIHNFKGDLDELVETSLKKVVLWDEVKDKLGESGFSLSGGQQQRLCIARTIAAKPDVILMDEPCSALDPISVLKIEELINELKQNYTVVLVTHNMQQAKRIADYTAFFNAETNEKGKKVGFLAEYNNTKIIFENPTNLDTKNYVSGHFG